MLPPDDPETARKFGLIPENDKRKMAFLGMVYFVLFLAMTLATGWMFSLVDRWFVALLYGVVMMILGVVLVVVDKQRTQ